MNKKYYGEFGGQFIPEILIPAINQLEQLFLDIKNNKKFLNEYNELLKNFIGRPTPLYYAKNFSEFCGNNNKIFLKREDLCHTGSHKLNNALGQVLLAKFMNKNEIIAETGAGQHGVATATACALLKMKCKVFMGALDIKRQQPNVKRMKMLGAKVIPVKTGNHTLKDAVNETLKYWVAHHKKAHYVLGSVVGPYPFPEIVAYFQSVIGKETFKQFNKIFKKSPDTLIACVGGGSNSIGFFRYFYKNKIKSELIGVEAAGKGINTNYHSATLVKGSPGVLHGCYSYLMQDKNGQIIEPYSISAGLDYPGIGPEHSYLKDSKIVKYFAVTDKEAVNAFKKLTLIEGIIPALESSHALAYTIKYCKKNKNKNIIICLSGRGDKDLDNLKAE